jgi:hypothetical protein
MTIERTDDALIVRSHRRGMNWSAAAFAAFSLFWISTWNRHAAGNETAYWLGLGIGISFILLGIFSLLPRSILTTFDLGSQCARRSASVLGWTYRDQTYPFADIAGVGIVAGSNRYGRVRCDPIPVLRLKAGPTLPLDTTRNYRSDIGESECVKSIENICAATDLRKMDT